MDDVTSPATQDAAEEPTTRGSGRRSPQNQAMAGGGGVYALGLIGAGIYFFKSAESREDYVLALPKAIVWPAVLVYDLLAAYHD